MENENVFSHLPEVNLVLILIFSILIIFILNRILRYGYYILYTLHVQSHHACGGITVCDASTCMIDDVASSTSIELQHCIVYRKMSPQLQGGHWQVRP